MGLDMYFKKIRKVKNKNVLELLEIQNNINYSENEKNIEDLKKEFNDFLHEHKYSWDNKTYYYFDCEVGYLRKANAIHKYIIDNFNNGVDDCTPILLDVEGLTKFRDVIKDLIYTCKMKSTSKIKNGYSMKKNKNDEWEKVYNFENGYIMTKESEEKAKKVLPTCEGFFFGGTEYDNYYFDDLLRTYKIINDLLLVDLSQYDIYYLASW